MFEAPALAVDIVKALLAADYATHLAAVCTERGVDYDDTDYPMALRMTRSTVKPEETASYDLPFAWVSGVSDGKVEDRGSSSITTLVSGWVIVVDKHSDGEILASRLQCHLVALARTFRDFFGGTDAYAYQGNLTEWTGTPPFAPESDWLGSVGVQIDVKIAEALD